MIGMVIVGGTMPCRAVSSGISKSGVGEPGYQGAQMLKMAFNMATRGASRRAVRSYRVFVRWRRGY